jgi:rhamnulose-1-phosphate aldolase
MKINEKIEKEIQKVSEIADYLWVRGWCERNAGNISIDLTGLQTIVPSDRQQKRFVPMDLPVAAAGMLLFVTGTGERLRDLISHPEKAACILEISASADGYTILWGGAENPGFRPTSEFVSHLGIHLYHAANDIQARCVLHTHPVELIAVSHHPVLGSDEGLLNKSLWSMLPEIRVFVPRGIKITPYTLPGSQELADLTIEALKERDVVLWSKHGALAVGRDAVEAFDFIDVANKGALIYLKCLQAGFTPVGMTEAEMKGLEIYL